MHRLRKSLGQHFLRDEQIARRIVESIPPPACGNLLEVGPGGGALTGYLLSLSDFRLKAVEIDPDMAATLLRRFPELKERLIRGNILEIPPPFIDQFQIIGNFPYNISSQILFRVLEWRSQVSCLTGMFQKEVAQRITAGDHCRDYGILSVLVQTWFETTYLFEVGAESFIPPPRVRSAVIQLRRRDRPPQIRDERLYVRLVKQAFGQRRKQLRNPLKSLFNPEELRDPLFTKRAEELSVGQYVELANLLAASRGFAAGAPSSPGNL